MNYKEQYNFWCTAPYFDENTKAELRRLSGDEKEIEDRFYRDLSFGTGGLRGVIGAGTNRMNLYTVRKATQGLANYIISEGGQEKGVAIAFDSRRMSPEFAEEAALCLAANGIKAYIFASLRPTPMLSFAVRELGCIAGIVITASHNPPEYNGYKVYWEDGAQITWPKDKEIIAEVNKVTDYAMVKTMPKADAEAAGLYQVIGSALDDRYMEELKKLTIHPKVIREMAKDIKIVYTPLHGTGNLPVRRVLRELGFQNVYVVPEQEQPDGDFPTVSYPNPEDPRAFTLALRLAESVDADIVLATDPDADRLGVYAKDTKSGNYMPFTGNMSGMILAQYILECRKETGTLPENGALVKTIVTTDMLNPLTEKYQVKLIEVLTGFKYIGEQIKFFEQQHTYRYLFGMEESYGCLPGTYARDKDAVSAVMVLCEAAAYYKKQGKTLWDRMTELYEEFGYFREGLETVTLKGLEGGQKIQQLMEQMRKHPAEEFAGLHVLEFRDYERNISKNMLTSEESGTGLPKSNVLYFRLENQSWCCARPSGTEPKIKFYMGVKGKSLSDSSEKLEALRKAVLAYAGL